MRFCSSCGAPIERKVPEGEDRSRDVCTACGEIFYRNPKVVAGAIPEWRGEILFCRRAIGPREGFWTLPAGFMEMRETTAAAAARETLEEANARIVDPALYCYFDIPRISQVYVMFRARLAEPRFSPGYESLETRLFEIAEIPWDELAFPAIELTLRRYVTDLEAGHFVVHNETIDRMPGE